MNRSALEREQDLESLRQIALLQHAHIASLIESLRVKCRELARLTGRADELQQTLQLLQSLEVAAPAAASAAPAPSPAPSRERRAAERSGPTPQPRLPVVEQTFVMPPDESTCPACQGALAPMAGQFEESEMIDVVDVTYQVVKVKRQKYVCRCGGCVVTAPGAERAAPGSRYSLDVAVKVAVDKYAHHLPLTRQVAICDEQGFTVTSQTLWDLVYGLGMRLAPVADALLAQALTAPVIGLDQTSWPRLEDVQRTPWQMWAVTAPGIAVHRIRDDKSTATFVQLIGAYQGTIVCDAAATHGAGARASPGVYLAGCWAHTIRKFKEAATDFPVAEAAIAMIRELYAVEVETGDDLARRSELRRAKSAAICQRLHTWLAAHAGPDMLSLYKAIGYTVDNWDRLTRFIDDARIPLDNNATERAFRGPVVGRRNYHGAKSKSGTQVAAIFFSLLETCKLHDVHPARYLRAASIAAAHSQVLLPQDFAKAAATIDA